MISKKTELDILVYSPMLSHPQDAGNRIRIYNVAKGLQHVGHRIHFVYYAMQGRPAQSMEQMAAEWDSFTVIDKTIRFEKQADGNYLLDTLYEQSIGETVAEVCDRQNVDMLICNYVFQSKLLESVPERVFKAIDTHDIFTDRNKKLAANGVDAQLHWLSFSREEEGMALERADSIIAIQDEEALFFEGISTTPVTVLGHLQACHFLDVPARPLKTMGFVGSSNPVNREAMTAFIDQFLASPLSREMTLHIAGGICEDLSTQYPSVVCRGFVDDLDDFYREMDLIINPLLFGTGLKIKTVEALSYGRPIVSTSIGFEGIKSRRPEHRCADISQMLTMIEGLQDANALHDLQQESEKIFAHYAEKTDKELKQLIALATAHRDRQALFGGKSKGDSVFFTRFEPTVKGGGGVRRFSQVHNALQPVFNYALETTRRPIERWQVDKKWFGLFCAWLRFRYKILSYWKEEYRQYAMQNFRYGAEWAERYRDRFGNLECLFVDDPVYFSRLIDAACSDGRMPIVAFNHNIESLSVEQVKEGKVLPLLAYELDQLRKCDLCITISREETFILQNLGIRAHYFPYYPPRSIENRMLSIRKKRKGTKKKNLLFVGTVNNRPTGVGLIKLIEAWREHGLADAGQTLLIAGYGTDKYKSYAEEAEGIVFLGQIDDETLDVLLETILATVVYQETGSGALTKIQEMLIAGVPMLANTHAIRSYDNIEGIFEFGRLEQIRELMDAERLANVEIAIPKPPDTGGLVDEIHRVIELHRAAGGHDEI